MLNYKTPFGFTVGLLLCVMSVGGVTLSLPETHAIVDFRQQCLIGGAQNGKWVPVAKLGQSWKGTHRFNLFSLSGTRKNITATLTEDPDCGDSWDAKPSSPIENGVAISTPDWNPLPRVPRAIDTHDTTYTRIVGHLLKNAGLRNPEIKIVEGYKVDLDGDGKDEVVIVASRYAQGVSELTGVGHATAPGDYAIVLVRKIVGGVVRNIFIVKDIRRAANEGPLARGYHLSAIADLNGDGRMELALYSAYYEGSSTEIIEINGTKARGVLWCGCEH